MRQIVTAVDEAMARRMVERTTRFRVRKFFLKLLRRSNPSSLELVYLPAYLVSINLRDKKKTSRASCIIEGFSGTFALFDINDALCPFEGEAFSLPPGLSEADAERIARESVTKIILRRRSRDAKPLTESVESIELLQYPYWVYYYRRRTRIDFAVLDAATGMQAGNKIEMSILDALRSQEDAHRPREKEPNV